VEERLGRLKAAEEHIRQAERLDPRSIESKLGLSAHLERLGRHAEARQVLDSALALAPASIGVIQQKAVTFLREGNLAAARAVVKAAPKEVSPTALIAYLATFGDFVWVLDEEQRELLLRLPPSAFESNEARAMCLVQAYALKGDAVNVRKYAEEAREGLEKNVRTTPHNAETHAILGLALAYLGRKDEAIREGEHAVSLRPPAKNADGPYYQHVIARIYTLVGEPEKALDNLEALLKTPTYLSAGWLKIDPNFDPLRKNPRFQKLVASAK
jgi:serine/threonine-protein kinase